MVAQATITWNQYQALQAAHPPTIIEGVGWLDGPCVPCEGEGRYVHQYGSGSLDAEYEHCAACDGKGYRLTPAGEALVAFMRRWLA